MKLLIQYTQGTLNEDTLDDVIYEIVTKAKAMEKEQIKDAYDNTNSMAMNGEQYYKETYEAQEN